MILDINESDIVDVTKKKLEKGKVILYPTDTVYGLGGDATSKEVVEKIHKVKEIEERRAMSVLVTYEMIEEYCEINERINQILKEYLPGPYTFLLKKKKDIYASPNPKIGVRIIDTEFCKELVEEFGKPIITTSANITGGNAPKNFGEVEDEILEKVDVAIKGRSLSKENSTVIDLVERKVLRKGSGEIKSITSNYQSYFET